MMQPQEAYENSDLHGHYQYVPLKQIIDDFLYETMDDDSLLKNIRRTKIIKHAKDALRELNKNVFNDTKKIEITVPESLAVIMPHDFVSFKNARVVIYDEGTSSFRTKQLNRNTDINIADGILQDHNAEILFDDEGRVLNADASNGYNIPFKTYKFKKGGDNKQISKYGEFIVDEKNGKILFSSDLYDKQIVLEYLTDGLQFNTYGEDEIKVHKNMIEVLKNRIYFTLIQYRRNIPQNEKHRALQRFKTTRHEARLDRAKFNLIEITRNSHNANF